MQSILLWLITIFFSFRQSDRFGNLLMLLFWRYIYFSSYCRENIVSKCSIFFILLWLKSIYSSFWSPLKLFWRSSRTLWFIFNFFNLVKLDIWGILEKLQCSRLSTYKRWQFSMYLGRIQSFLLKLKSKQTSWGNSRAISSEDWIYS